MPKFCLCTSFYAIAALFPLSIAEAGAEETPSDLWHQDTLTGNWGGLRPALADHGITFGLNAIGETLSDLSGGRRRGSVYEGREELSTDFDFEKLLDWNGASAHATGYWINGRGPTVNDVGNLMTVSNIEASRSTRLFTAWFQKNAFDDHVSLRAGQIAADDEFLISPTAGNLINGTFGWAWTTSANLPNSGPVYPLAAPGARLRFDAGDDIALLGGLFSGNPEDPSGNGTRFRIRNGTLAIGEVQYALNQAKDSEGLSGTYKLGGWHHSGQFGDLTSGLPAQHRSDYGFYGIADQTVWKPGESQSLNLFLRLGGAPQEDRNLIDLYADGGVGYTGLIPGRDNDVLTLGIAYASVANGARQADRTAGTLVRDYESIFEVSYVAQIAPWWILQPDVQYVMHPGGGAVNPTDPTGTQMIPDATLIGLRTVLHF